MACAGRLLHSHNYRENSSFKGQRVVIMGASASGQDISRDIAQVADKVMLEPPPLSSSSLSGGTGRLYGSYEGPCISILRTHKELLLLQVHTCTRSGLL